MGNLQNSALIQWLADYQGLDMTDERVAAPARSAAVFAETIRRTAAGLAFDTEPANFYKLLHDLAPNELKTDDIKSGEST